MAEKDEKLQKLSNAKEEEGNDSSLPDARTIHITTNRIRKSKRLCGDLVNVNACYSSVSFIPRQSTGMPDCPHFFFSSSYAVILPQVPARVVSSFSSDSNDVMQIRQVVHQHANGLCVVTAGKISLPPSTTLKSIRFVATEGRCNAAERRKRQAKMLKGGRVNNVVHPTTVIAELIVEEDSFHEDGAEFEKKRSSSIPLCACVWGTILELNRDALTPQKLLSDPLLDGWIAIILPSGQIPINK